MNPLIGSSIISAGANLLGGGLSFLGAGSANAANAAFAQQQLNMQQQDFNRQMDFAQQQFNMNEWDTRHFAQIRAADAAAAGVSPLVAMGMPSYNGSNISVGGSVGGESEQQVNELTGTAQALGGMSQDISRTMARTQSQETKDYLAAQTKALIGKQALDEAHINALNAQANYWNAHATTTPSFPTVEGSRHGQGQFPDENVSYGDRPVKTTQGTMEYVAAPGTPGMFGGVEGAISTVRNRLGPQVGGIDQARIMMDIRKMYPGAVGFEKSGMGYRPVFPDEEVQRDVDNEYVFKRRYREAIPFLNNFTR